MTYFSAACTLKPIILNQTGEEKSVGSSLCQSTAGLMLLTEEKRNLLMTNLPSLVEMLQAGVHFGHQASRWHPKMEPYIFTERGGIHIVNLEKTQEMLQAALEYAKGVVSRGGVVLFVGTKRQAQEIVKREAEACAMPYVSERWLGGTLTNFGEIKKLIKRFKTLKDQQAKGELRKYTKKEQLMFAREIEELQRKVGGIERLERMPEAMFIVDMRVEKTALAEARTTGIPVIAICDTNVNPQDAAYPIPANDDAVKGIEMLTHLMSLAVQEGKLEAEKARLEAGQAATADGAGASKAPTVSIASTGTGKIIEEV